MSALTISLPSLSWATPVMIDMTLMVSPKAGSCLAPKITLALGERRAVIRSQTWFACSSVM